MSQSLEDGEQLVESPHETVRVLTVRRNEGSTELALGYRPGKELYQPCTGHLEKGEDWKAAALREGQEEMNLDPNRVSEISRVDRVVRDACCRYTSEDSLRHRYHLTIVRYQGDLSAGEEFERAEWLTTDEILDLEPGTEITENSYQDIQQNEERIDL